MSRWRSAATAGLLTGLAAAGAAGGVVLERRLLGGARGRPDPEAREPFGSLRTAGRLVRAADGTRLAVEEAGAAGSALTMVFVHGFALSMDSWHYQRRDLTDLGRLVFYDARSHGASERGPRENATIDQLGRDLETVLEATGPHQAVVLVGHSMGGMTVMALAERRPELFGSLVRGVALLSTAPGRVGELILGVPAVAGRAMRPLTPGAIRVIDRRAALIERGRRPGSDLTYLLVRHFGFGDGATPARVALLERMLAGTPIQVMAEFFPGFTTHDKLDALPVLRAVPTVVLVGDKDRITPIDHSRDIAAALPTAELVVLTGAGHMVMLERAALVNLHLRALARRATRPAQPAASA
jgi:pimeloyl-ACP methyl ester carboxylesterase